MTGAAADFAAGGSVDIMIDDGSENDGVSSSISCFISCNLRCCARFRKACSGDQACLIGNCCDSARAQCSGNAEAYLAVIARSQRVARNARPITGSATKQSMSLRKRMDCFAPLAMTTYLTAYPSSPKRLPHAEA
jgi:hypothetical protein